MLTFEPLTERDRRFLTRRAPYHAMIAALLDMEKEDALQVYTAHTADALFVRIYDGKTYEFLPPYSSLFTDKDNFALLENYAKWQEIPLVLTDLSFSLLTSLLRRYRHADVDMLDEDGHKYRLRVRTELEMLDGIPTIAAERVLLSPLTEKDAPAYERLCRRTDATFGYDYRQDNPDADGKYFLRAAEADFAHRAALTLAVRLTDGTFVGETTLHAFDGRGAAEFSVRILPEYRRRGLARETLYELTDYAFETLGLTRVLARCLPENIASLAMLTKLVGKPKKGAQGECLFVIT